MRYKQAPIIEAVCEFRFTADSPWDSAMPGLIYSAGLSTLFPKRSQGMALQSRVQQTAEGIEQQIASSDRIRFARADGKVIVQVGPHFLAINHLAPYPGWPALRPLIDLALTAYRSVAQPKAIQRIGLRFINMILVDEGGTLQHEKLLDFYPYIGPRLPQTVNSFVCGVAYSHADGRDALRLQLATVIDTQSRRPALNLDLDYFTEKPATVKFDEVSDWLESGHQAVENAFEGAVKDELRQRFEPETGT